MTSKRDSLKTIAASLALIASSAVPAHANGNVLQIVQDGTGNSLNVDQSAASGSSVNGLILTRSSDNFVTDSGSHSSHGHHNYDTHGSHHRNGRSRPEKWHGGHSPLSFLGNLFHGFGHHGYGRHGHNHNVLEICDPAETVSFERLSAEQDSGSPAIQKGSGNSASITIAGNGGQVGLLQSNSIAGTGHTANINVSGGGSALVGQLGDGNIANLSVDGGSSAILQEGYSNEATLSVGSGSAGLISQIGNSNHTELTVPAGGASVSYLVYGNGLTGSVPASVISNAPGSIVIRQYQSGLTGMPGSGS